MFGDKIQCYVPFLQYETAGTKFAGLWSNAGFLCTLNCSISAFRVLVKRLANAKSGDYRKWKYCFVELQSEIGGKQNWELMGSAVIFQWDIKFSLELPCSFDQGWPKHSCFKKVSLIILDLT